MSYIFTDESGDLGFDFRKMKTSRYFLVSFLLVNNKRPIEKIVKKIFHGFSKKEIKNHHGTLHSYKEKPVTRRRLLTYLSQKDIAILAIILNKRKVYTRLQDEKHVLYNYIANILLDRLLSKDFVSTESKINLIVSQRETNKFLNKNFRNYLENQTKINHKLDISIVIEKPKREKCLQLVDFVSWSIFRKYEHQDDSYYKLFKEKVNEEKFLFGE